jgi:hypothetical protein
MLFRSGSEYRARLREVALKPDRVEGEMVVFASAKLDVARSPSRIEAVLAARPTGWLPASIELAWQDDIARLREVAPPHPDRRWRFPLREEVEVHAATQLGLGLLVPLDWHSRSPDAIFPAAEVDLEMTSLEGASGTRIEVRARILAPAAHDRQSAHREGAERFARRLMARIGARLVGTVAA